MKRVMTLQDISCIGKCSLTVALPILSALGIEAAIIPTALLSTHTAFSDFTFKDLTDQIEPICSHWEKEGFSFDAIYTGYLGSKEQIDIVISQFKRFKTDKTVTIVDPAMADMGKLYTGFDESFVSKMTELCKKADIIIPNMTEACMILGKDYKSGITDSESTVSLLKGLCSLGPKKAVITGVCPEKSVVGAVSYDSEEGKVYSYYTDKVSKTFHGTGDIFASTFTGTYVNGFSFEESVKHAVDFTYESIKRTIDDKDAAWYGVNFEEALPELLRLKKQLS